MNPDLQGLDVKVSEFLVATSDGADGMIERPVLDTLQVIRKNLAWPRRGSTPGLRRSCSAAAK